MIAEAQNVVSFGHQITISPCVALDAFRLIVLPAVDLNNELCSVTDKVDDEGPDRLLPSKACTTQLMSA